ncbi:thiol reductant ABC exporter subunit CydC [Chthonobacter rhizosphaerae]|uniref:thiol reductant ABC exporter subunit CydC n=1 Tax=Chthonobacter rhizosphaerae TaxID=2735553 RepID=UPI0015EF6F92|nr:thiol reductant ABC exporter subunit CydC [Chthonobacter rhizosphaerae]
MRALLAIMGRFARTAPARLAGGILLAVATLASGLGLLAVSGYMIAGAALAGLGLIVFDTFRPSAAIRFFALTRTGARYLERLVSHDATFRVLAALRVDVFRGIARGREAAGRSADLLARLSGDLDALDAVHLRFAAPLAAAAVTLAALAAAFATLGTGLALAAAGPAVLLGIVGPVLLAVKGERDARRRHHAVDAVRRRLVDLDRGRTELAVAGRLGEAVAAVGAAADRVAAVEERQHRRDMIARAAGVLATQAAIAGALVAGAGLVGAGAVSGPVFALVVVAAFAIAELVQPLRTLALDLGRMLLAARRVAPLMRAGEAAGRPVAGSRARSAGEAGGVEAAGRPVAGSGSRFGGSGRVPAGSGAAVVLEAAGVAATGGRVAPLRGVSLRIEPGERVALVGPSGAGKSTLLALLAGLVEPAGGRMAVDGFAPEAGRPDVGLLTQRTELFRGTVRDALALGRPDGSDAVFRRALETVALWPVVEARGGLHMALGEGGAGLSGGERRRLALARLLVAEPALLLLDEPTDGLDAGTAARVMAGLAAATEGRTVVLASHLGDEAAFADRLVRVDGGRIVADARRGTELFERLMAGLNDRAAPTN